MGKLIHHTVTVTITETWTITWTEDAPADVEPPQADGDATILPAVCELIVDGDGAPLCITELIEVEIKPFNAVDEQFAFDYGEGDRTLTFWLRDNWEFLSRWCAEIGRTPSETMPIVFQRFRVLYP